MMTGNGGPGRSVEERLWLLEYQARENSDDIKGLRTDMNSGFDKLEKKVGEQTQMMETKLQTQIDKANAAKWATWTLVAALMSAVAAIAYAVH